MSQEYKPSNEGNILTPEQKYMQELRNHGLYNLKDPEGVAWLKMNSGLHDYVVTIPGNSLNLVESIPDCIFPTAGNIDQVKLCKAQENAYNAAYPFQEKPWVIGVGKVAVALNDNKVDVYVLNPTASSMSDLFKKRTQNKFPDVLNLNKVKELVEKSWSPLKSDNPGVLLTVK